jgi:DnaJ-class molecular chaperone
MEQKMCSHCNGEGFMLSDRCEVCNGYGYVIVDHEDRVYRNIDEVLEDSNGKGMGKEVL